MALSKEEFNKKMAEGRAKAKAKREAVVATHFSKESVIPSNGGNGNGKKTLLDETIENEDKKKGKPPVIIIPSQLNAFSHDRGTQAVDYIVRSGDDIKDLLMRTNFESRRNVRALARIITKARAAHNKEAEEEALFVAAGDVSVGGESREQLIRAIVGGDPKSVSKGRMDFKEKTKNYVFGKHGKDKDGEGDS